jgi:hypothetical protein
VGRALRPATRSAEPVMRFVALIMARGDGVA